MLREILSFNWNPPLPAFLQDSCLMFAGGITQQVSGIIRGS